MSATRPSDKEFSWEDSLPVVNTCKVHERRSIDSFHSIHKQKHPNTTNRPTVQLLPNSYPLSHHFIIFHTALLTFVSSARHRTSRRRAFSSSRCRRFSWANFTAFSARRWISSSRRMRFSSHFRISCGTHGDITWSNPNEKDGSTGNFCWE